MNPRPFLLVGFAIACLAGCQSEPAAPAPTPTPSVAAGSPVDVVTRFADAWNKHDAAALSRLVEGATPSPALDFLVSKTHVALFVTDASESISGDEAHVKLKSRTLTLQARKDLPRDEQVTLRKVGSEWKILPNAQAMASPAASVVVFFATQVAHPKESFDLSINAAEEKACVANLKKIAIGMIVYLADHKLTYPASFANIRADLNPYVKDPNAWSCPAAVPGGIDYTFNAKLAGVREPSISSPATLVMAFEEEGGKMSFRHNGRAAVAFDDAQVRMVSREEAAHLRFSP